MIKQSNEAISLEPMQPLQPRIRDLDSFEEFFFYMEQISPTLHGQMVHVAGPTSREQWERAWKELHLCHPLLYMQIRKEAGRRPFFVRTVESAPISIGKLHTPNEMTTFLGGELARPFRTTVGALVRAEILHGADESLVSVLAHHSLYDGMGTMVLLQDLLHIVGGSTDRPTIGEWRSLRKAIGVPERGGYQRVLSSTDWGLPTETELVASQVQVRHIKFERELTSRIERRAHAEGTTPHGALMAAMQLVGGRTRTKWLSEGLYCNTPHDVRRSIQGAANLPGMLTMPLITFLRPVANRSFWDMAREYRDDLVQARSAEAKLAFVHAIDDLTATEYTPVMFLQQLEKNPCAFELMITDYGSYRPTVDYGSLHLLAIATGNNGEGANTQTIGVCTLDGSMNLTQFSKQPIEGLLEGARDLLSEVCA